jgi:hypothetical protein
LALDLDVRRSFFTRDVAFLTLSTSSPLPDSPVEYDSIATYGSIPTFSQSPPNDGNVASCSALDQDSPSNPENEHPIRQAHEEHTETMENPGPNDLEGRPMVGGRDPPETIPSA